MFSIILPLILSITTYNWTYQEKFKIKYFNNSICKNNLIRQTNIELFYLDTQNINSNIKYCKNIFDKLEIINNTCYNFLPNKSIEYSCGHDSILYMNGKHILKTIRIILSGIISVINLLFIFVLIGVCLSNSLNYETL